MSRSSIKMTGWLFLCAALMMAFLFLPGLASADTLFLPSALEIIEEEAFMDNASLDKVVLPEGLRRIENRAFANSTISSINLPVSVEYIAKDAFSGTNPVAFEAVEGSYAYAWGIENNFITPVQDTESDYKGIIFYDGHAYALYEKGMIWAEAESFCEAKGGHLVTITSAGEQKALEQLINIGEKNNYWTGGMKGPDSEWKWVTEEPFSYVNWCPNQPDNFTRAEDRIHIYNFLNPLDAAVFKYGWNDVQNDCNCRGETFFTPANFGFICEWEDKVYLTVNGFARNISVELLSKTVEDSVITLKIQVTIGDNEEYVLSRPYIYLETSENLSDWGWDWDPDHNTYMDNDGGYGIILTRLCGKSGTAEATIVINAWQISTEPENINICLLSQGDSWFSGIRVPIVVDMIGENTEPSSLGPVHPSNKHEWESPYCEGDTNVFICKTCGIRRIEPIYSETIEGFGCALTDDDGRYYQWYKEIDTNDYLRTYYSRSQREGSIEVEEQTITYLPQTPADIDFDNTDYIAKEEIRKWYEEQQIEYLCLYHHKTIEIDHRFIRAGDSDQNESIFKTDMDYQLQRNVITLLAPTTQIHAQRFEGQDIRSMFAKYDSLRKTNYHSRVMNQLETAIREENDFSPVAFDNEDTEEKKKARLERITNRLCEIFETDVHCIYINMDGSNQFEDNHGIGAATAQYTWPDDNVYVRYNGDFKSAVMSIAHELRHAVQYDIIFDINMHGLDQLKNINGEGVEEGIAYKNLITDNRENYWNLERQLNQAQEAELREIIMHNVANYEMPPKEFVDSFIKEFISYIRSQLYMAQPVEVDTHSLEIDIEDLFNRYW